MVKGFSFSRYGVYLRFFRQNPQPFYWRGRWSDLRGGDSFNTIVNQRQGYRRTRTSVSLQRLGLTAVDVLAQTARNHTLGS